MEFTSLRLVSKGKWSCKKQWRRCFGFAFPPVLLNHPPKRSITVEVHPTIPNSAMQPDFLRQVDDLITRRNPSPQSWVLWNVQCLWPQSFMVCFALVLFFRKFCWIIHQEINHHRSASINSTMQPNFLRQVKDLITLRNPTPQSWGLCVEAWVHKDKGHLNFTFVKEQCIT